jgi:Na+/melibiose symporter-like transporter
MVCFYLVPLLPFFATQDITPETLKVSVISAAVLMMPLLYLCLKNTPKRSSFSTANVHQQQVTSGSSRNKNSLGQLFQSIVGNKPLTIFFCAFSAYGFAAGMWYGLVFLYVDSYLGLGEYFAQVFLLSFIVGIVATPVWCTLAIKLGKKTVLSVSMVLLILSYLYASLLTPEDSGFRELLVLQILNILGGGCMMTFAPAMLSEIVDYGTLKYRIENTASFYALFMFLGKFTLAVGGGLGLAIAGWYGLDATTTAQTAEGVVGLLIGMAWLPIVFILIALVLIVLSPINTRRHGIIRRRLDSRSSSRNPNGNVLAVIEDRAMA